MWIINVMRNTVFSESDCKSFIYISYWKYYSEQANNFLCFMWMLWKYLSYDNEKNKEVRK